MCVWEHEAKTAIYVWMSYSVDYTDVNELNKVHHHHHQHHRDVDDADLLRTPPIVKSNVLR